MKLIIGLGNPGKKYQTTWHNAGFSVLDLWLEKNKAEFSKFKPSAKFEAELALSDEVVEKIILAKPQTFMNNSGQAVAALAKFYKLDSNDIWVIHDDIDLPLGKIRISQNSSSAGHNGIKSIIEKLNTQNFTRFRIGIQPNYELRMPTEKFVLQKIDKQSKVVIDQVNQKVTNALDMALDSGVTEAMNQFN